MKNKLDSDLEFKKKRVHEAAIGWWEGKKDPKVASLGTYVCDACGGPIIEKEGTSLLGSYMRCANCTRRMFNNWEEKQLRQTRRDKQKGISKTHTEHIEVEKCFHCGKNPGEEKSQHIITLVWKNKHESGGGNIKKIVLPRCNTCKHYVEWGDRTFIVLLPLAVGLLSSLLITNKLWLVPILLIAFYLPLVFLNIKLIDLAIPKWKDLKAADIKKHSEIKSLLEEGWKIKKSFKEKILAIW